MTALIIVLNVVWTLVALVVFVVGYLEGRKQRRTYELEAVCMCGDRIIFPAHYTRDTISRYMLLHSEWHDRQEAK